MIKRGIFLSELQEDIKRDKKLTDKKDEMTLSSCQVVLHLSPRWDTGGLCSASPINPTLIKAFCLMK